MMGEKSIPNFRIFSIFLAAFLAGVLVSSFFQLDFHKLYDFFILFSLIFLAAIFIFRQDFLVKIVAISAAIFLAGFVLFIFDNTRLNNLRLPFGEQKEFSAEIISYPDISGNSQSFYISTSDFDRPVKIYIKTSAFPAFAYGDRLKIKTMIEKPENVSSFDWIDYLKRYGVVATTANNPQISLISAGGNRFLKELYSIRNKFEQAVEQALPEPESSLAIGILIGSKQGFSSDLINDFAKVGITHIIALSGFNVTVIIIFLSDVLLGFCTRRQVFAVSIAFVLLFVAMTGAASSIIRAAIITLLVAFGKTIGRRADMTNLILLSAAIMVAINPFVLKFDTGFQLSFLAFIGLIYFSPLVDKFFSRKIFKIVPSFIKSAIGETLSAQIFVLPLILSAFGLISLIAPLSNVLILPIIPASMFFIFLSTLIYWLFPMIGKLAFLITYLPLKYIIDIAINFAKLPVASLQFSTHWQVIIVTFYILAVAIFMIKFGKINDKKIN